MPRIRLAALAFAVALLPGGIAHDKPAFSTDLERIQGTWEIVSVHRAGQPDPLQIGEHLTFSGNEVMFAPNKPPLADGTSWPEKPPFADGSS